MDGSAARLHPHQETEAQLAVGIVEDKNHGKTPVYVVDHGAVQV